jgi:hypothetical protein
VLEDERLHLVVEHAKQLGNGDSAVDEETQLRRALTRFG